MMHQAITRACAPKGTPLLQDCCRRFVASDGEACFLCGSALKLFLNNLVDNRLGTPGVFEIWRCIKCGFEQTSPRPSLAELKELYKKYYNFGGNCDTLYTKLRELFLFSFVNRMWTWLDGDVAFHRRHGTGRLLDIGCNEGRGLRIFARNGFAVEGLELSETAAVVARHAGFEVHTCPLEQFNPTRCFDVAVLSNVLEHSLDPRQMLLSVHRILANGGQVWISCPNSKSWLRSIFGRAWINWHVPFHVFHFSPETVCGLLADTGFSQLEVRQITPALWVAQSAIASLFAKNDKKTLQLRNPFLTGIFMFMARFVLFPGLWLGNHLQRGDCLLVTGTKA